MKTNIKIAKELIKIAKQLLALKPDKIISVFPPSWANQSIKQIEDLSNALYSCNKDLVQKLSYHISDDIILSYYDKKRFKKVLQDIKRDLTESEMKLLSKELDNIVENSKKELCF